MRRVLRRPGDPAGRLDPLLTFARFGLVGLVSSGFSAATLYVVADVMRIDARIGSAIAYVAALPLNYVMHRRFTFSHVVSTQRSVPKFLAVHFANLLVTVAVVDAIVRLIGWPLSVAIAALVTVVPIVHFLMLEAFVFLEYGRAAGDTAD